MIIDNWKTLWFHDSCPSEPKKKLSFKKVFDKHTIDTSETGDALLKLNSSSCFPLPAERFLLLVGDSRRTESWEVSSWEKESREAAVLTAASSALKCSGDGSEWAESWWGSETLLLKSAGCSSGTWKVMEASAVWLWVTSANSWWKDSEAEAGMSERSVSCGSECPADSTLDLVPSVVCLSRSVALGRGCGLWLGTGAAWDDERWDGAPRSTRVLSPTKQQTSTRLIQSLLYCVKSLTVWRKTLYFICSTTTLKSWIVDHWASTKCWHF